jgi:hypothetical protein
MDISISIRQTIKSINGYGYGQSGFYIHIQVRIWIWIWIIHILWRALLVTVCCSPRQRRPTIVFVLRLQLSALLDQQLHYCLVPVLCSKRQWRPTIVFVFLTSLSLISSARFWTIRLVGDIPRSIS